jgi:hypothetical protein
MVVSKAVLKEWYWVASTVFERAAWTAASLEHWLVVSKDFESAARKVTPTAVWTAVLLASVMAEKMVV